jgi:two-component system CheB/CheR fusion protein
MERQEMPKRDVGGAEEEQVLRLETELHITQGRLQATIDELGSINEKLQSANVELQAVNGELAQRASDLAEANCDLKNLVESTQIATEAALRASERRFGEAQQLAGVGVWEWNLDTDETWWSPVVYQLWGSPAGETPPALAARKIHPEDRDRYAAARKAAAVTGVLNVDWRVLLPDGSTRWLAETGGMESADGGRRMLGVVQDITGRKQTERRLTMLLGELQHRVRNILGVVRSIVARTVRSSHSIEDLARSLDGRLDTFARTQGVFTRPGVSAVELEDMIRDELVAVAAGDDRVEIDGPPVRLVREAAETFALALHELTTNAVKYGALSEPAGRLAVRWQILDTNTGQKLVLEWRESGVRALDISPSHFGFGRELIERGLPYELDASTSLEFLRGGVRARIEAPLSDKIVHLDDVDA